MTPSASLKPKRDSSVNCWPKSGLRSTVGEEILGQAKKLYFSAFYSPKICLGSTLGRRVQKPTLRVNRRPKLHGATFRFLLGRRVLFFCKQAFINPVQPFPTLVIEKNILSRNLFSLQSVPSIILPPTLSLHLFPSANSFPAIFFPAIFFPAIFSSQPIKPPPH